MLVNQFFFRFGVPIELHSDQGRDFESTVFKEVVHYWKLTKQELLYALPAGVGRNGGAFQSHFGGRIDNVWQRQSLRRDKHIPLFLMAYRTAVPETTKVTPSQMMLGREMRVSIDLWIGPSCGECHSWQFDRICPEFGGKIGSSPFICPAESSTKQHSNETPLRH